MPLNQVSLAPWHSCEKTGRFLASEPVASISENALYVVQGSRHNTPRIFNRPTPHVLRGVIPRLGWFHQVSVKDDLFQQGVLT